MAYDLYKGPYNSFTPYRQSQDTSMEDAIRRLLNFSVKQPSVSGSSFNDIVNADLQNQYNNIYGDNIPKNTTLKIPQITNDPDMADVDYSTTMPPVPEIKVPMPPKRSLYESLDNKFGGALPGGTIFRPGDYGISEKFAENNPTISRGLATLASPFKAIMDNPFMNRSSQTAGEIVTLTDRPDKVSTGSKYGDIAADLVGGVVGFGANPESAGAKLFGLSEKAIAKGLQYVPKVNKLPELLQSGLKIGGATVPYEAVTSVLNDREFNPAEAGQAGVSNAALAILLGGAGKALNKRNTPPTSTDFKMPEYKEPDMSDFTPEELANFRSKSSLREMITPETVTTKDVAAAQRTLRNTPNIEKANKILDEFPELEREFPQFRLQQGDKVILPNGKEAIVKTADKMIIQVDVDGKTASIGRKVVRVPEVKVETPEVVSETKVEAMPENVVPEIATEIEQLSKPTSETATVEDIGLKSEKAGTTQTDIPLSPGISPMSVKLPDTMGTIASKTDGNSLFEKLAPSNVKNMVKKAYYKTVDGFNRLNDFDKAVAKNGGSIPFGKRAFILGHNTSNSEALAQRTLTENMVDSQGNVIGAPLKDTVQQVPKGEWRKFEDYLKLKHSKAWENSDMTVYDRELNMSPEMADLKLAKYDAENPWMAQAAKDYTDWINQFGEAWLVKTGLISENVWNAMRTKYGDYIPMQRLMEDVEVGKTGAKGSFADQPNPAKRAKGSERKTIESLETMIERVPNYIKSAKRNEVMGRIIEGIRQDPEGMSIWGEIVDSSTANLTMPNIVAGRINGERVHVRVNDPMLLDAISGLTPQAQNVIINTARALTGKMKLLTTGINPVFSLGRNVVRDLPMSYVASKSTNNPIEWSKDIVGALLDILGNRAAYKSYKDMGGGYASAVSTDANILGNTKAKLLPGYYDLSNIKNPVEYTRRLLGVPFKALEKLADVTEAVPRVGEYRRIIRKEGDSYASRTKALFESKDVTVNFQKKNTAEITNFLDTFIPYFGASINGLDKLARIYKDNPVAAINKTFAAITVPTLMLYAMNYDNEDYQKLSSWVKDTNHLIPLPNGTFLKLPKPREGGVVFGALVERTLDSLLKDNPDAFYKFMDTVKASFLFPTRTIAAPRGDLRANKDFVDRPIVPKYMENMSPGQQYDEKTSSFAKKLGELYPEKVSPKQVDYLVKSYLGVIGQIGIPALSEGSTGDALKRIFTADPAYSTDVTQKFYDAKNSLDTMKADTKQTGGVLEGNDEKLRKLYGKVAEMISDNRNASRKLQKDGSVLQKQKTIKLRDMQLKAVALADIVNQPLEVQLKIYDQLKRRRFITEDRPKSPAKVKMDERKQQKRNSAIENILSQ